MRTGRPLAPLSLSEQDRIQLLDWTKRPNTAQALAMRSRIVLLAAQGNSNKVIAARLHTIPHTAGKWRKRYLQFGLDGLLDEPRPGTSRKLRDQQVEQVLTRTLESQHQATTHWSTRDIDRHTPEEVIACLQANLRALDTTYEEVKAELNEDRPHPLAVLAGPQNVAPLSGSLSAAVSA